MGAGRRAAQQQCRAAAQLLTEHLAHRTACVDGGDRRSQDAGRGFAALLPCEPWTPATRDPPELSTCMAAAHRATLAHRPLRLACALAAVAAVAAAAAPAPSMAAPTAATAEVQAKRARDAKVVPDIVDNLALRRVDLLCLTLARQQRPDTALLLWRLQRSAAGDV